jgi:predicted outer membrane protein
MKLNTFFSGSLATLLAANAVFAQQPASPQAQLENGQSQPGQLQPGQLQSGQAQAKPLNQSQPQTITTAQPSTQVRQGNATPTKDQVLASCLAIGNKEQVEIAKFAIEKTKNSPVKEFATMLHEEHQACVEKLAKFAPQSAQTSLSDGSKPTNTSITTSSTQNPQNFDAVALHQELAQQCLKDTKEMLSEKEASKFDQCFIGMQLARHAAMKTQLTVFQRHATGELKDIITQGLETTKKHMKTAENLMEQLTESDVAKSRLSRKSD